MNIRNYWLRFRCAIGWHTKRMRYCGSLKGEGRASGATHFVIVCKHCEWMEFGGMT